MTQTDMRCIDRRRTANARRKIEETAQRSGRAFATSITLVEFIWIDRYEEIVH